MKDWIFSVKAAVVCFAIVLAPACGKGGQGLPEINGVKGPIFNIVDGKILLTMKFLNLKLDAGIKVPIPETRESAVEFSPNVEDGGMMLQFFIDVDDLRDINIGVGDANTLPDGRPVPGFPSGQIDNSLRVDTTIKGYDMSFYFSKKFFGFWMPFGFETAQISGYWNIWLKEKNVGMLGIVGNEVATGRKAGGLVLLRLENLKSSQLNRLIKLSKRNPHMIY